MRLRQIAGARSAVSFGIRPDERHMGEAVILLRPFEQQAMFAQVIAMIRSVDLHGFVGNPCSVAAVRT